MRDEFTVAVKQIVANRVNSRCSNPDCHAVTSGPQMDPAKSMNIGVAAHISAASVGGPRFDRTITSDERSHASNAIWLCQNCAKKIDNDEKRFTKDVLLKWKESAEFSALAALGKTATHIDASFASLSPEEIDILCAAADKGEIHVIEVDELSPWVMVNGENFADDTDPACAAEYLEAIESLQRRRLVRHESGILYGLRSSGFEVARALNQARLIAAEVRENVDDESDEESRLPVDETVKIPGYEHASYSFKLDEQCGIRYEVDSNDRLDVLVLDPKDYKKWRNTGEIVGYFKSHTHKCVIDAEFWPSKMGEYRLVVSNPGLDKVKADVKITLLDEI